MTVGERIKQARKARGMSQHGLANAAGISQAHLSNIESEKRGNPGERVLRTLAAALEVNVAWLIDAEGPRERATEDASEPEPLGSFDAARVMFIAQEGHDGRGDEARRFLAERSTAYAGAERKSPRWWLETLSEEFREWRAREGTEAIPKVNPRRRA